MNHLVVPNAARDFLCTRVQHCHTRVEACRCSSRNTWISSSFVTVPPVKLSPPVTPILVADSQACGWNPLGVMPMWHRGRSGIRLTCSLNEHTLPASQNDPYSCLGSIPVQTAAPTSDSHQELNPVEMFIERAIFNCRFLTLMAVGGSLAGSLLCFFKGCTFVVESFVEYFHACWHGLSSGKVILLLVEAVDVYLMGTVMLIFGMGVYELFVSSLEVPGGNCFNSVSRTAVCGSNLFGLFQLRERPKWLEIRSLDELKTKLGHVIVMILLVGMFEKSKKVQIHSGVDLLCFSASILLSAGCLFLLSKLHSSK